MAPVNIERPRDLATAIASPPAINLAPPTTSPWGSIITELPNLIPPATLGPVKTFASAPNLISGPKKREFAVRPAHLVEDGHSRAEQQVYAILWENATPLDAISRLITLGFASMGKLTGLSESNARINLRSLIQKLAIEEHTTYDCAASQGRTYRIYDPAEILRRRHEAGLRWVMRRTLAVVFVDPQTKLPLFTKTGSKPGAGLNLTPPLLLANSIRGHLQQYGPADSQAVQCLIDAAQQTGATVQQLAEAIHDQALLTTGMTPAQRIAFLLDTVPGRLPDQR